MAIVTNKEQQHAIPLLRKLKLDHFFKAIIGGDSAACYKPDPAPIYKALELLHSNTESALMIGDSKTDIGAARNAGIPVIAVDYGYNHGSPIAAHQPDMIISHLSELPNAIKNLPEHL